MTLALALAGMDEYGVFILADMMLSYREELGRKPIFGLKIFFIDKNTAIAYANNAGPIAHERIQAIYKQGFRDDLEILAEQISRSFDQEVDFLLARSGTIPCIVKIANGDFSIGDNSTAKWIGDGDVAKVVANSQRKNSTGFLEGLERAFENPGITSVGGHAVLARGTELGFKFVPRMKLISPRYRIEDDAWYKVDFGTAASGGFGLTTITPSTVGTNGWGLFYFQGSYGEYWHVDLEADVTERLVARNVTVSKFIAMLEKETGNTFEYCGILG